MSQMLSAEFGFRNGAIVYEMLRQNSYFETLTLGPRVKRNLALCEDSKQRVAA
jgi:hypothetical protein